MNTNEGPEIVKIPNRGHALTVDSGWREGADTALQEYVSGRLAESLLSRPSSRT